MKLKILCIVLICSMAAFAGDVIIKNGAADSLTSDQLKKIYFGKVKRWDNGTHIEITLLKDGDVHLSFMRERLKKRPDQFLIYWKQLMFTGRGVMPESFSSEAEMIEYIAATPGAIGYISEENSTELPESVSLVRIE